MFTCNKHKALVLLKPIGSLNLYIKIKINIAYSVRPWGTIARFNFQFEKAPMKVLTLWYLLSKYERKQLTESELKLWEYSIQNQEKWIGWEGDRKSFN